jgi:hypothetical protein
MHSYLNPPKSYTLTHKKLMQDNFGVKMLSALETLDLFIHASVQYVI